MNCYGLNRFGPIEKKERPQNLQEKKEIDDKLSALLAARQKQDSIWTAPVNTQVTTIQQQYPVPQKK